MTGNCVSSCCRSASITAANGALDARMPSMQAPERPRRPIRRMQRTRQSCRARPPHHVPGAVGGIVVDEDDFPRNARKRGLEPPKKRGDIVAFVEGGNHDRKSRHRNGLRRVFGGRSDGFIHAASIYPIGLAEAKAQFPKMAIGKGIKPAKKA